VNASAVRLRRLFFALWPDETTREALRRATRAVVRHCGGKPVPPHNYHLTLAFLGNVPEEQFEAVCGAARGVSFEPVTLTLDQIGHFPAPQVLWIAPSRVPEPLPQLAADLARAMTTAGAPPDIRAFHPHLTLARKVQSPPESLRPGRTVEWWVEGFALADSVTHPNGARYRVVAEFPVPPR
jgi:2'-5' RNA ligase